MPHLFQLAPDLVEILPGIRHLEAGLLEEVLPVSGQEHAVVLRDRAPDAVDVGAFVARGKHLAVLPLELGDEVGHVDELGLVEPGEMHPHLDEVVAGLRLHLGGVLGRLLGMRDVVDADPDASILGEPLADLRELFVGSRREVVPAEIRDLPLLTSGGRDSAGENGGDTAAGGRQERASAECHGLVLLIATDGGSDAGDCSRRI